MTVDEYPGTELPPELFYGLAPLIADFVEQYLGSFREAMREIGKTIIGLEETRRMT